MVRELALAIVAASAISEAHAFEFRCRFVERVGSVDIEIPGQTVNGTSGTAHRIRLQFGVFDDASGPAPAGGFVGWNVGTLQVSGSADNSDESRTPGRLAPFTFTSQGNGQPAFDPFTMLTAIDATLGTQAQVWVCDAAGNAPPQPPPITRGINTFVSVFEFTSDPRGLFGGGTGYTITAAGNLIGATEWLSVGTPSAPDCGDPSDPSDDVQGSVIYAPRPTAPTPFSCTLTVFMPTPGTMSAMLLGLAVMTPRRRVTPKR
jgi:hypothetical protein